MNLIMKVLVVAVAIVVLLVIARYAVASAPRHVSSHQAVDNVTSYIDTSYPGALVTITSVNSSQYAGSWHIVASVVINATKACPAYYVYSFDYPQYGFVSRLENNYTANCIINGEPSSGNYIITSYPIAMAKSYDYNISAVRDFVAQYGYSNVNVSDNYYDVISLGGSNYSHIWLVMYSNPQADHSVYVGISQRNGTLLYAANGTS